MGWKPPFPSSSSIVGQTPFPGSRKGSVPPLFLVFTLLHHLERETPFCKKIAPPFFSLPLPLVWKGSVNYFPLSGVECAPLFFLQFSLCPNAFFLFFSSSSARTLFFFLPFLPPLRVGMVFFLFFNRRRIQFPAPLFSPLIMPNPFSLLFLSEKRSVSVPPGMRNGALPSLFLLPQRKNPPLALLKKKIVSPPPPPLFLFLLFFCIKYFKDSPSDELTFFFPPLFFPPP